ncbi:uncharacterized protein Dwil_GK14741 [Drosophila willistoni]|uniref:Venom allergen-1 n=2 Tax=Drosophila willistoni TaxID=7260 RepID=B4NPP9_DROWI|nr:uncharacterized protein Dwil_GK14741 [Drosophila willistoni]
MGQTSNYCDKALCGTSKNIACNNNGAWSSNCPKRPAPVAVTFNAAEKATILDKHNTMRNTLASGKLSGYKAAKRMATMRWNDELAKLAALNTKQCEMKHDECRNTNQFRASGQNIAFFGYSGTANSGISNAWLASTSIDMWWNEYKDCKQAYMDKYPSGYSGPQIGHFTGMSLEKNTDMGCAAAKYVQNGFNMYLMTCNYATTNYVGLPVYESGTAASGCTKGKNYKYTSLCSESEVYKL